MKKKLLRFGSYAGVFVLGMLVKKLLDSGNREPLKASSLFTPYCDSDNKVVGVKYKDVVFTLHDAPRKMTFDEACRYCGNVFINNRACALPRPGIEDETKCIFPALNKALKAVGGQALHAEPNEGYWAAVSCSERGDRRAAVPWIVALDDGSGDSYGGSELAYVRPVLYVED